MILLHDYVLVKPITETKTNSGIILTAKAEERQMKGEVVEVGTDVEDDSLKEGSIVVFDKLNSSPSPEDLGEDYLLCQYDDIIAIL